MNEIEKNVIDAGLGENGLIVLARMGEDPGKEYFDTLLTNLFTLFQSNKDSSSLSKELSHALYCVGHFPYLEYTSWIDKGATFRDDLIDQVLHLEMAVQSIFAGEWLEYFNEEKWNKWNKWNKRTVTL